MKRKTGVLLPFAICSTDHSSAKLCRAYQQNFGSTYTSPFLSFFMKLLVLGFVVFDAYTIYSIICQIYNDDPRGCAATALVIAALIDGGPYLLSKILSSTSSSKKKFGKRMMIAAFVSASLLGFLLFLSMTVLSMFTAAVPSEETVTLAQQAGVISSSTQPVSLDYSLLLRSILPLATSLFSFLLGLKIDSKTHRIHVLLARRNEQQALLDYNQNIAKKFQQDLRQFDVDRYDFEQAKISLKLLCSCAEKTLLKTQAALAEELGTVEAANQLLDRLGFDEDWFNDLKSELMFDLSHQPDNSTPVINFPSSSKPHLDEKAVN